MCKIEYYIVFVFKLEIGHILERHVFHSLHFILLMKLAENIIMCIGIFVVVGSCTFV